MNKPEPTNKIKLAQSKDQNTIHSLFLGFKLPLDGLDHAKLSVLESQQGTARLDLVMFHWIRWVKCFLYNLCEFLD
jgi:hypothetical protein